MGGVRPGAGRPKGSRNRPKGLQPSGEVHTGRSWLLAVINNPVADVLRKDRAAAILASIEYRERESLGKKVVAEQAAADIDKGTEWEHLLRRTPAPPPRPEPPRARSFDDILAQREAGFRFKHRDERPLRDVPDE